MIDVSDLDADVWEQTFLETVEEETENHRIQVAKNLKHLQKHVGVLLSCSEELLLAENNIHGYSSDYAHYEMILNKVKRECNSNESKIYKVEQFIKSSETELKTLREETEGIQDDILQLSEDLERLTLEEQQLVDQRREVTKTMQSTWMAYIEAKNRYKKNLECHVRLHDMIDGPKNTENELQVLTFSFIVLDKTVLAVKLSKLGEKWKMLNTDPVISEVDEAETILQKTNDIRSFLFRLRKEALKLS